MRLQAVILHCGISHVNLQGRNGRGNVSLLNHKLVLHGMEDSALRLQNSPGNVIRYHVVPMDPTECETKFLCKFQGTR